MIQMTKEQAALLQTVVGNRAFKEIVDALLADEKEGLYQSLYSATLAANWNLAAQIAGNIQAIELYWGILQNAARQSQKLTEPQ